MKYLSVSWNHDDADDPVLLYSELDDERYETRKVEIRRDGRMTYAGPGVEVGDTWLGEVPVPALEEIAQDPQFTPKYITAEEFEAVWLRAIGSGGI